MRVKLHGPYVVDYTDVPHDGDTVTLWTPQVGDVLLRLFPDAETVEQWSSGLLSIGQMPGLVLLAQGATNVGHERGGNDLDNILDAVSTYGGTSTGAPLGSSAYVFHTADPVKLGWYASGPPTATAGHVELFALIARPVSP